jgi:hypothetical protein
VAIHAPQAGAMIMPDKENAIFKAKNPLNDEFWLYANQANPA